MIERKNKRVGRIGVFGVAHPVYWDQFPGLLDTLMQYHEEFKAILAKNDVEIVDYGMIDTNAKAYDAIANIQGDHR